MEDVESRPMHTRVVWLPWHGGDLSKLPPFNKLQMVQYKYFFGERDIRNKRWLRRQLPGVRYLLIKRRNLVATAVSQYITQKCTGAIDHPGQSAYFVEDGFKREEYEKVNLPISVKHLWKCYMQAVRQSTEWDEFVQGEEHIEICFECFMSDPEVREEVCDFVGVRLLKYPFKDFATLPIRHPQKEMLMNILSEMIESGEGFKMQPELQPLML
jgi:hypothetical protein